MNAAVAALRCILARIGDDDFRRSTCNPLDASVRGVILADVREVAEAALGREGESVADVQSRASKANGGSRGG